MTFKSPRFYRMILRRPGYLLIVVCTTVMSAPESAATLNCREALAHCSLNCVQFLSSRANAVRLVPSHT